MNLCFKKILAGVLLFIIYGISFADNMNAFSPSFGVSDFDFNATNPDIFSKNELMPTIRNYFKLSDEGDLVMKEGRKHLTQAHLKIYSYNEISPGRYIVYGYLDDSKDIMQRITPNEISDISNINDRWGYRQKAPKNILLAIVDTNEQTVYRLNRDDKKPLSNLRMSPGGRHSSGRTEVYGCLQAYPTTLADINGDQIEDLIFIGGNGALYLPDEQITANTELVFFLGDDFKKNVLTIDLHEENFLFYFDESGNNYQVSRDQIGQRIKDIGLPNEFIRGTPDNVRPGYRTFAKVYFGDFDNDEIHSVLVWRRSYLSRKKNDPVKGFEFDNEEFEMYDIKGNVAHAVPINNQLGHNILENHQLKWSDGFPKNGICDGPKKASTTLVMDYGHPQLSIQDPVLLE